METVYTEDLNKIKKAYRKISLVVHPDKNKHPQVRSCTDELIHVTPWHEQS